MNYILAQSGKKFKECVRNFTGKNQEITISFKLPIKFTLYKIQRFLYL